MRCRRLACVRDGRSPLSEVEGFVPRGEAERAESSGELRAANRSKIKKHTKFQSCEFSLTERRQLQPAKGCCSDYRSYL
jgi:hypothetical protein